MDSWDLLLFEGGFQEIEQVVKATNMVVMRMGQKDFRDDWDGIVLVLVVAPIPLEVPKELLVSVFEVEGVTSSVNQDLFIFGSNQITVCP